MVRMDCFMNNNEDYMPRTLEIRKFYRRCEKHIPKKMLEKMNEFELDICELLFNEFRDRIHYSDGSKTFLSRKKIEIIATRLAMFGAIDISDWINIKYGSKLFPRSRFRQ
jgi:hypothetical protein